MYFACPFTSQVIIGWSAGACAGLLGGLLQSYARNSACRAGVMYAGSLALVGDAVGVAGRLGSGVGYGVELPSCPTNDVAGAPVKSTGRSCSCAELWMR